MAKTEETLSVIDEMVAGKQKAADEAVAGLDHQIVKFKAHLVRTHFTGVERTTLNEASLTPSELAAIQAAVAGKKFKLEDGDSKDTVDVCAERLKELAGK